MNHGVSFAEALRYWFKLGFISFGGPAGQIAIMHQELVEKRRWISEHRFLHALNYCMVLPGPEAQQLATYIGWLMHGVWGGIAAGALFVLPSLFILIGLSWIYLELGAKLSTDLLYGIKPAVVAVVLFAAYRIGRKVLKQPLLWAIAAAAFIAVFFFKLPFPAIVATAGVVGWIFRARLKAGASHEAGRQARCGPALIDDGTPVPEHARFSRARLASYSAAGLGLWVAALGGLAASTGAQSLLTQMGVFFTKAALVTFGGAYAVMPYVFQNAVETYAWLTPAQMMDGLALGETTPGPLIMVVAFIGYVGACTHSALGPGILAGIAGASVATFFTFLPSFLFILIGGPLVERTRDDFKLAGPLTAITAAVVGAILYLAALLAWHVFWPAGFTQDLDGFAALLSFVALVVMLKDGLGMIPVILLCGASGLAYRLLA